MRASSFFFLLFSILIYPAVLASVVLYLYPLFTGCEFPRPSRTEDNRPDACAPSSRESSFSKTTLPKVAPFRLLAFGDPQLEGDSSLPNPEDPLFPGLAHLESLDNSSPLGYTWQTVEHNYGVLRSAAHDVWTYDIPRLVHTYRKHLDLWGNDYYLAHIYRTLHWWLEPTHVTVLGDLLGSQWISDEEFSRRSWRFWNRVFRHGTRVEDDITSMWSTRTEVLGEDASWSRRVITVPGNHDVGYAGDMTPERMERFEREFGKTNWDITFTLPTSTNDSETLSSKIVNLVSGSTAPSIRLVSFNSMNLDGPAYDPMSQEKTYAYLNSAIAHNPSITRSKNTLTLILTHIPLHKPEGVCTDRPFFSYHDDGGIREQNHLSRAASAPILEGLLGLSSNPLTPGGGLGRQGLVLTGHDHEGCDVYHHVPADASRDGEEWTAAPWESLEGLEACTHRGIPGVREVSLRSMMGEYSGNAGLISAWFDDEIGEWRVEVGRCTAGVQHLWWGVHGLDIAVIGLLLVACMCRILEAIDEWRAQSKKVSRRRLTMESKRRTRSKSRNARSKQAESIEVSKRSDLDDIYAKMNDGSGGSRRTLSSKKRIKADG